MRGEDEEQHREPAEEDEVEGTVDGDHPQHDLVAQRLPPQR